MHERAEKLGQWLVVLAESYENLLSRTEELASVSGFDKRPRTRLCEHRREWFRGGLCLACDNTGWRPCARYEEGIDPYASQLKPGVTVQATQGQERQRELRRIESSLADLSQKAKVRAGMEAPEDNLMRSYRILQSRPRTAKRILRGLEWMRSFRPMLYAELPSEKALLALAIVMYHVAPGRIESP